MLALVMLLAGTTPAPVPAWPASSCRPYVAGQPIEEGARLGSALQQDVPAAWRRRSSVDRLTLSPAELSRAVTTLACIATWPGQEDVATAVALPLFASRQHGQAAFAATDALARSAAVPGPMRAAAHGFHARMTYLVGLKYGRV